MRREESFNSFSTLRTFSELEHRADEFSPATEYYSDKRRTLLVAV